MDDSARTAKSTKSTKTAKSDNTPSTKTAVGTSESLTEEDGVHITAVPKSVSCESSSLREKEEMRNASPDSLLEELYTSMDMKDPVAEPAVAKPVPPPQPAVNQSLRSRRSSVRQKPTILTFARIQDKSHLARCQMVLCNISERALHFTLKCNPGSDVIATPFGNAHIAPHAQVRLVLTWTKRSNYETWKQVPSPKLLLITRFMDDDLCISTTQTRLLGRISRTKTCPGSNPPVEQLLLDAVGKPDGASQEKLYSEKPFSPASMERPPPNALADFVNNLNDRGLCVLIILLLVLLLLVAGSNGNNR